MREIERGERESRRRVLPARRVGVGRPRGRGGNLGFLGTGMKRIERIELRLVRVLVDVKEDDLDMMTTREKTDIVLDPVMMREKTDIVLDLIMRIGKTDIVPEPVMKTERTDTIHDPMKKGVNDTAQPTVTKGKTANLPDRDSIEKKKYGDHVTKATHHLDQNCLTLVGMVISNQDLERGMIGIDVQ